VSERNFPLSNKQQHYQTHFNPGQIHFIKSMHKRLSSGNLIRILDSSGVEKHIISNYRNRTRNKNRQVSTKLNIRNTTRIHGSMLI